jgi:hypothetical protein
MGSLAVVVSIILLCLILLGPITYVISSIGIVPKVIKYLLGIIDVGIGIWALFIPVPMMRILGLVNLSIGIKILLDGNKK